MTTPALPATDYYRAEMNAVNLGDDHVEEAVAALNKAKATIQTEAIVAALCSLADGILAIGAKLDALRETLNRELPEISAAIIEDVDA